LPSQDIPLPILNKINKFPKIISIYNSQDHYKIQSNDTRLKDKQEKDDIVCYVSQQKGFIKYINKNEIKIKYDNWKVLTTSASHGEKSGFGNVFIAKPNEVHCKSYIGFNVMSENEAESLLSYIKCKLPNFLLSLRKMSHNLSSDTCKWIPLPPLNKEWNDEEVYKYFNLSEDEIKLIKETKISGYKDIKTSNENEPIIIKDGRKQYYLINDKLYKIKKDKTHGELFGSYIDNKIIEQKIVKYNKKEYILEGNIMYKIMKDENNNIIKGSKCGLWNDGNVTKYVKKSKTIDI